MSVYEKIEAQQKGKEQTAVWMVGEQLKEILRADPSLEAIVDKDLDNAAMNLEAAEGMIHNWANKHKTKGNSCVCVPPNVAEEIIRDFYGLPGRQSLAQAHQMVEVRTMPTDTLEDLNLIDFL